MSASSEQAWTHDWGTLTPAIYGWWWHKPVSAHPSSDASYSTSRSSKVHHYRTLLCIHLGFSRSPDLH
ncbi:MAG: hypothetical protein ACLTOV_00770 [Phocaeicola sp.]